MAESSDTNINWRLPVGLVAQATSTLTSSRATNKRWNGRDILPDTSSNNSEHTFAPGTAECNCAAGSERAERAGSNGHGYQRPATPHSECHRPCCDACLQVQCLLQQFDQFGICVAIQQVQRLQ